MRIVITGADGFLGKNLRMRLTELGHIDLIGVTRSTTPAAFQSALTHADFVFHLAGVNRPQDPAEFASGNVTATQNLCNYLVAAGRRTAVLFASSTQAHLPNPYGESKRAAEEAIQHYHRLTGAPVHVFRLTNVFGKWCRPNYNSVVATFCHNIARGLPITINDPQAPLLLVYIDDVIDAFLKVMAPAAAIIESEFVSVNPVHATSVGEVANILRKFSESRTTLLTQPVGMGLIRALYSTYISYLPVEYFTYDVPRHIDQRGIFVEMLKTPDCGQFSYFTALPGITRGGHYHHSKSEKFLVIKGTAHFGFRHITTGETHQLVTNGGDARIVETVPGWAHNITNIGHDELIVMLWANEIFDRQHPDTVAMKVKP